MTARDWQMLTETPPEWDWLGDIREWMCPPYSDADISRWHDGEEKRKAMERRKKRWKNRD
jgi:hypothetical protein